MQIVVQMVRMERNWNEVDDFVRFWRAVPGVDQVRIKADETNLMRPDAGHEASEWRHPCHYLWRGPMYVKHNGDVYPCCQSYMLDGTPAGNIRSDSLDDIWNSPAMQGMREAHASGRGGDIDVCARCCTTIPHPLLVAGSLIFHGRTVRRLLPLIERLVYVSKLPAHWLRPPKVQAAADLVQIEPAGRQSTTETAARG
jgi:radical SAM protein with 4Fe4S-binding SPASM domain